MKSVLGLYGLREYPRAIKERLFPDVAAPVYETTLQGDRGLRDPLLDILWDNKATLLLKPGVQECIMAHEGFKNDVVESLFMDPGAVDQQTVSVGVGTASKKRSGWRPYSARKRQMNT